MLAPTAAFQLSQELHLDSQTLNPMLKKLEAMNYLKRNRSQTDELTVAIQLTYSGK